MGKRFVFVCGDMGGANYQLPVIRELVDRGNSVVVVADGDGNGVDVFKKANIIFWEDVSSGDLYRLLRTTDLFFVNTCASASKLEELVLQNVAGKAKIVMGSDGLFNHGFSKWRAVPEDARLFWFAINEGHAQAIQELRPGLNPEKVMVVGQPAFDSVLDYIPRKQEVRANVRKELGLTDSSTLLLWWSQGMLEVISEDICMLLHGLERFRNCEIDLAPRLHPKLNQTVSEGYVNATRRLLNFSTFGTQISIINANQIKPEELCLAADVILSITCTEDVKNVMMGGPPVVHLMGPLTRRWFENDLGQTSPYLPDIRTGQSLVAWSAEQVGPMIERALHFDVQSELLSHWQPPTQKATRVVADKLVELASS